MGGGKGQYGIRSSGSCSLEAPGSRQCTGRRYSTLFMCRNEPASAPARPHQAPVNLELDPPSLHSLWGLAHRHRPPAQLLMSWGVQCRPCPRRSSHLPPNLQPHLAAVRQCRQMEPGNPQEEGLLESQRVLGGKPAPALECRGSPRQASPCPPQRPRASAQQLPLYRCRQ